MSISRAPWAIVMAACFLQAGDIDVEKIIDIEGQVDEQAAVLEYLDSLMDSPLNVNDASVQQLCTIPWISPTLAVRLVHHRYRHGPFDNLEDIKKVSGFSHVYDKISPFLTVGKRRISLPFHAQGRHCLFWQVEDSRAFQQQLYSGSRFKIVNRLRCSITDNVHVGAVGEKDAGERSWDDFRAGYVMIELPFIAARVIAGSFSASFGQGLVFWGSCKMSKGSDPVTPAKQRSRGLYPYLSAAENDGFCGVGISARLGMVEMHVFSSHTHKDARIDDGVVMALTSSGLHRTAGEIATYDRLEEFVCGASIQVGTRQCGRIGCSWQGSRYASRFPPHDGIHQFDFSGDHNTVAGIHYDLATGSWNVFGEAAQSQSGGRAYVAGLWYDLGEIEVAGLFRHYDRHFHNFYAVGFAERDGTRNEKGVYFGLRYHLDDHTTLSFFLDQYFFAWPYTSCPMPSSGVELLGSIERRFSDILSVAIRFRAENKEKGVSELDEYGNAAPRIQRPHRSNVRLQLTIDPTKSIRLRSRIEFSSFADNQSLSRTPRQLGALISQDVRWRPGRIWSLQIRCSIFDVPSYEHRFYQYENDLPGVMGLKMLNGRGKRSCLLLSCWLSQHLRTHLKYANTWYDDKETIGSGNDIVYSPCENHFSFQFEWHF
ncbi:helix-hairpin-helix domain-containing protein [candidate division KSB1 bacterium]|nr:helix-hairpin-helix domain-containing protein [candidate division KSB1 bacterium]